MLKRACKPATQLSLGVSQMNMNPKIKVTAVVTLMIIIGALILSIIGRNPVSFIGMGIIVAFMLYVLWDMPDKHKEFTWKDQQKALFTSTGGNPPPELPNLKELENQQKSE